MPNLESVTICCLCPSIKRRGEYHYVGKEIIKALYEEGYQISHGYCPDCYQEEMIKLFMIKSGRYLNEQNTSINNR